MTRACFPHCEKQALVFRNGVYFMITECIGQGYVYGLHGLRL